MYRYLKPFIFKTDPEQAHQTVINIGSALSRFPIKNIFKSIFSINHPGLQLHACGINFDNPVGLGAGFDKNGELIDFFPSLGFGFVEIGSVTSQPSEGNPKPRVFRLPIDRAIINRMGLNNEGVDKLVHRLSNNHCTIPLGINIAKTHSSKIIGQKAIDDFCDTFKIISDYGDYIALNISCPNTKEGKTFEEPHALDELLSAIKTIEKGFVRKKPLFIKISPDITYKTLDEILDISERYGINGYVICNTSLKREGLRTKTKNLSKMGKGGLSGAPIKTKATEMIAYTYRNLKAPFIIGIGGIFSAADAYEKIRAGASLIQIYTGLIYEGPSLVKNINKGLISFLKRDGFSSVKEAVGTETF